MHSTMATKKETNQKLAGMLETSPDWAVAPTTVPGVWIQKMPGTRNRDPKLAVAVNLPDDKGQPSKRRHLYIKNLDEIKEYQEIFANEKLVDALKAVGAVNGEDVSESKAEAVIEI